MGRGCAFYLLLVSVLATSARAEGYFPVPVLPISVLVVDAAPGPWNFCRSEELRAEFERRVYVNVALQADPRTVPSPHLILVCAVDEKRGLVSVQLQEPGKPRALVDLSFKTVRGDLNARQIALEIIKSRKAARAAEEAYMRRSPALAASSGRTAAAMGDWKGSANSFFAALQGEEVPAPFYRGLTTAYARLGKPRRAYWYFLAHAKSSGENLDEADLAPLVDMKGEDEPEIGARETELAQKLNEARARNDVRRLVYYSEEMVAEAPWAEDFYGMISEVYRKLGWKRLSKSWRRRQRLAREVNKDQILADALRLRLAER